MTKEENRIYHREYRKKNRESLTLYWKEYRRKWRELNRKKHNAYNRQWHRLRMFDKSYRLKRRQYYKTYYYKVKYPEVAGEYEDLKERLKTIYHPDK